MDSEPTKNSHRSETPEETHTQESPVELDIHQYSIFREFWCFMKEEKKWWLAPILLVLLLVGAVVILGETVIGPFIYTFL